MADGSRTLKLSILADVDNLKKGLTDAGTDTETFGGKLSGFGKAAGAAFAVAGAAALAYAGALLVDGVKAAVEDEAAQVKLATAIKNVTDATDATIASVESYITQTALAVGVSDDELRPSFARLVKSTGDVEAAMKLQGIALDASVGSGKSLETTSNLIAKAFDGNTSALAKLDIGLTAAELKTMSFDEAIAAVTATYEGSANAAADTFAGKIDRLKIAFDEGKETVGAFVLDAITPMVTLFVDKVIPTLSTLATDIGEDLQPVFESLGTFFKDTFLPGLTALWDYLNKYVVPIFKAGLTPVMEAVKTVFKAVGDLIEDNTGFFKLLGVGVTAFLLIARPFAAFLGGAFKTAWSGVALIINGVSKAIQGVVAGINGAIKVVNLLIKGYNIVNNLKPGSKDLQEIPMLATGGLANANSPYIVGERGPELFVPSGNGRVIPNNKLGNGGGNIYINVSGAIDQEGTARRIVDVLNNSFYRGTNGANALAF
jgi:phage-related protein